MAGAKVKVAILSVLSNTLLIILKIIAGILSGSVSIISEAIHSGMDLLAAIIAFFSVRLSDVPADEEHPYGHGKIESISGVIEGLLIFAAASIIITEALQKIISPHEIGETRVGIAVMGISAIVNMIVSSVLYKTAKKEDSLALEADALHLKTDVLTSAGVAVGLLLIQLTHITILDPMVAILVALLIIKESIGMVQRSIKPLLDYKLSDEEEKTIKTVLDGYSGEIIDYHAIRTRKSGSSKFIDFHMTVKGSATVEWAHALSERIEEALEKELQCTNVTIHVEPETHRETQQVTGCV